MMDEILFSESLYVTFVCVQEVGMPADYVNKLARMFQDIKVSEDLNQSFKEMHKHYKLALPGQICHCYDDLELYCCTFELIIIYVSTLQLTRSI